MNFISRAVFFFFLASLPIFGQGRIFVLGQGSGGGSGNAVSIQGVPVSTTLPTTGQCLVFNGTIWAPGSCGGGGGGGTVTSVTCVSGCTVSSGTTTPAITVISSGGTVTTFTSGNLSPLFTTSVATATTTPALSFSLSTAAANSVFGNFTGSTAAPAFSNAPVFSAANLTSFPTLNQSTTGNAQTATGLSFVTGYSVYGSGASLGSWITPTGNAQCLMSAASSYATTTPSFQSCSGGLSGLTSGVVPQAGSSTTIVNSSPELDNGVTTANTLTYAGTGGIDASGGPVATGNDGVHSGQIQLYGNTVNFGLGSNLFSLYGPPAATFTAYGLQFSATGPAAAGTMIVGAPSSGVSQVSFGVLPAGDGGTGVSNTASLTLGTSNRNYATLGTGIEKNTTTTGAVTLAASSDVYGLFTSCTGSSGLFLKDGGTCAAPSGGSSAFPLTVSGTVNSGGIPYFNSTTQESSSAVLASTGIVVGGGAGTAPATDANFTYSNALSTQYVQIGNLSGSLTDPALNIGRTITASTGSGSGNSHGFTDQTTFNRTGSAAYNSFQTTAELTGGNTYDHISGFQSSLDYNNSGGTATYMYSFLSSPNIAAGTLTNMYAFYVQDVTGGNPGTNFGLYISALTSGNSCGGAGFNCNWGVYQSAAALQSYWGGKSTYGDVSFQNNYNITGSPIDPVTEAGTVAPTATGTTCQHMDVRTYNSGNSYPETFEICTGRYSAAVSASPNTRVDFNIKGTSTDSLTADLTAITMGTNNTDTNAGTFVSVPGNFSAATYNTPTNCSSAASPAVCGSAAAGSVLIPTGTTSETLTVNTTAVTANSQIFFYPDDSLGTKLSTTCNSTLATLVGGSAITARVAGTSFTITFNGSILTNGVCGSYEIKN